MKRKDGTFNEGSFVFKRVIVGTKSAENEGKKIHSIKLPDDPDTVILTYNSKGGYRMPTPVGFQPTPLVRVFASGKVVIGRNTPDTPELEFVLNKTELAKLLEFVVNEKRILDITTEGLKQQIEASGKEVLVADAPTDQFLVNLPKAQHDVEMYGLLFLRSTYQNIEDVQSLAAIREKLMFLRSRAALGSQEDVDRLMEEMTQEFKKRFPNSDPLILDDLVNASINKDGSVQAQFARLDDNGPQKFMYSGFVQIKDEKIKVDIIQSLAK